MESQIVINIPEGKKAIQEADKDGNIIIKYVDKEPIRSKTWDEFCKNHPQISYEYFLQQSVTRVVPPTTETRMNFRHTSHGEQSKCLLASKEDAEGILALIQLTRLHDEWVGDWEKSIGEYCYSIRQLDGVLCAYRYRQTHSLLSFPTPKMAREFFNCFKDLIETAKKFI